METCPHLFNERHRKWKFRLIASGGRLSAAAALSTECTPALTPSLRGGTRPARGWVREPPPHSSLAQTKRGFAARPSRRVHTRSAAPRSTTVQRIRSSSPEKVRAVRSVEGIDAHTTFSGAESRRPIGCNRVASTDRRPIPWVPWERGLLRSNAPYPVGTPCL